MILIKLLSFSITILVLGYFFYQISTYLEETDFPVFYCAAKIAMDPATPTAKIYDTSTLMGCKFPELLNQEQRNGLHFIYSIPAAQLLTPLGLLPYFHAKTLIIILNIVCYLAAIHQLLKSISSNSCLVKPFRYCMLASLWLPFQFDIRFAQINSILFLAITVATAKASKKPFLSGFLFGIASLFKLFPLGIALLIGLKNWRVAVTCISTLIISLTLTDSWIWFAKISNISRAGSTPIHLLLDFNFYFYITYTCIIIGITTSIAYLKSSDDTYITGFAITSLFIIIPIVEYYHLVLLMIPIFYMVLNNHSKSEGLKITTALPVLLITISPFQEANIKQYTIYISCLILWTLLLFHALEKIHTRSSP